MSYQFAILDKDTDNYVINEGIYLIFKDAITASNYVIKHLNPLKCTVVPVSVMVKRL